MNPFIFMTSVEAVQLTGLKAASLGELDRGLEKVEGASIYHHTHRFYRAHSFLGPSDRFDFALWVGQNLREAAVAEEMGALDLRNYSTLQELRDAIRGSLAPLRNIPERWERCVPPGLEFHFCGSTSLVLPVGYESHNLEEFLHALERVDVSSIYYHLIEAPLHLYGAQRRFHNDFSHWLFESLQLEAQAQEVADIDPYRSDLEALRRDLISVFRKDHLRHSLHRVLDRVGRNPSGEAASHWLKRWRKAE